MSLCHRNRLVFAIVLGAVLLLAAPVRGQIDVGLGISVGGALNIGGVVDVSVSGTFDSFVLASGSSCNIASGVQCSATTAQFQGGTVSCDSSSQLAVQGACTVTGSNYYNGGTFSCDYGSYGCSANVASGSAMYFNQATLSPTYAQVADQGTLQLNSCTVAKESAVAGSSGAVVTIAHGTTTCNAPLHLATPCSVPSGGELRCTDNGPVTVAENQELTLTGGTCSYTGTSTSVNHVVVSAGSKLACRGQAVSYHAGGVCNLADSTSQLYVEQGSTHYTSKPVSVVGSGKVHVEGTMQHEAAYTSTCAHEFTSTSAHVMNNAYAHTYGSLSYAEGCATTMKADAQGYTAARVTGAAQFAGSLHLQSGSYAPASSTQSIPLYNCGSATGQFSSVTSDSATVKGQVHYTATGAVWMPYASGPCTSCTQVM